MPFPAVVACALAVEPEPAEPPGARPVANPPRGRGRGAGRARAHEPGHRRPALPVGPHGRGPCRPHPDQAGLPYPHSASGLGARGRPAGRKYVVLVRTPSDDRGRVRAQTVVRMTAHPDLEQTAAIAIARCWSWAPGRLASSWPRPAGARHPHPGDRQGRRRGARNPRPRHSRARARGPRHDGPRRPVRRCRPAWCGTSPSTPTVRRRVSLDLSLNGIALRVRARRPAARDRDGCSASASPSWAAPSSRVSSWRACRRGFRRDRERGGQPRSGGAASRLTTWSGADGAHSRVRHELGLRFDGHPYPQDWLLADVTLDWARPDDEIHAFFAACLTRNVTSRNGHSSATAS